MIHLVICTESPHGFSSFMHGVERYRIKHKRLEFNIQTLTSKKTLRVLKRGFPVSIFFIDNDNLPNHGLLLTQEIQMAVPDAVIIFLSSTKMLAFDAFSLHVQRYLLMPIKQKHLFEALDYSLFYVKNLQKRHLGVNTSRGLVKITHDQLNYIESRNRVFFAHCKNGRVHQSVALRKSFEYTLGSLLSDSRFVQTHKSFIVNMSLVKDINSSNVIMQNGSVIPVAQARYGHVRTTYRNYLGLNSFDVNSPETSATS